LKHSFFHHQKNSANLFLSVSNLSNDLNLLLCQPVQFVYAAVNPGVCLHHLIVKNGTPLTRYRIVISFQEFNHPGDEGNHAIMPSSVGRVNKIRGDYDKCSEVLRGEVIPAFRFPYMSLIKNCQSGEYPVLIKGALAAC
jgi:hypothetical protein